MSTRSTRFLCGEFHVYREMYDSRTYLTFPLKPWNDTFDSRLYVVIPLTWRERTYDAEGRKVGWRWTMSFGYGGRHRSVGGNKRQRKKAA